MPSHYTRNDQDEIGRDVSSLRRKERKKKKGKEKLSRK